MARQVHRGRILRTGTRSVRALLPLVALSMLMVVVGPVVVAQDQPSEPPAVPTLWFGSEYGGGIIFDGPRYISTIAPAENASTLRHEIPSTRGSGSTPWHGQPPAQPWAFEEAVVARAYIWVDFPKLIPFQDEGTLLDPSDPASLTEFRFGVQYMLGQYIVAEGYQSWPYDDLPEGEHALVIDAPIPSRVEYSNESQSLYLEVRTITRGARSELASAATILYGSPTHPSRVEVPGYAWASTNAHEAALVEAQRCLQMSLSNTPCEDPTGNGSHDPSTQRESVESVPAAWTLLPAALIAIAAVVAAWRARR